MQAKNGFVLNVVAKLRNFLLFLLKIGQFIIASVFPLVHNANPRESLRESSRIYFCANYREFTRELSRILFNANDRELRRKFTRIFFSANSREYIRIHSRYNTIRVYSRSSIRVHSRLIFASIRAYLKYIFLGILRSILLPEKFSVRKI
jgi:hypothetical protein